MKDDDRDTLGTHATVERITPEVAAAMLASNRHNRSVRARVVEAYARDMANGAWHFTGDSIKFAADGMLLDGQHRLLAIVKSGVTLELPVVRGLARSAQDFMDIGVPRPPSDMLRLNGERHPGLLASVARMVHNEPARFANVKATNADIDALIEADPSLRWVVDEGLNGLNGLRQLISPTVLGYTYWKLNRVDPWACAEFFSKLLNLNDLPAGSPILALNRRLAGRDRLSGDGVHSRREMVTWIFTAWNAWRRGQSRTLIKTTRSNGQICIPEPI